MEQIKSWSNVNKDVFENEIMPLHEPAVLRGIVDDWPIVESAKKGTEVLWQYLRDIYVGGDVRFARLPAIEKGRFFYNETKTEFNFEREIASLDAFLNEVLANSNDITADTLALQSALIADYFPSFNDNNGMDLFENATKPRIWLGNNSVVSPHYDDADNIACVVTGTRTFTLFPPEQIDNLYVGPMEFTPAGAPVSFVDLEEPDLEKYPKFAEAISHAVVSNLSPGDAIYIPALWWHNVKAEGGVNLLVNYWSGGSIGSTKKPVPIDNILMAMLTIRELPQHEKNAWQSFFNYYIFSEQSEKYQHIPDNIKGMLAPLDGPTNKALKKWLIRQLK